MCACLLFIQKISLYHYFALLSSLSSSLHYSNHSSHVNMDTKRGQNSLDRAGWSVAISGDGNVVAFGAPKGGSNRGGAVFSYQFKDGLGWKPNGQVIGGLSEDNVGFSVSLSYDGSLIAVGSPKGSSTFGPANAGKNAVYEMRKPIWAVFTSPIHGETTDDSDGTAVAFSQDGTILVTGARGRDGNKGYCRVYERNKQSSQFKLIHTIAGQHAEEQMGSSAAVSSDGNVIACGGTNGSWKGGTKSGVVRLWNSVALSESIIWPREKNDSYSEGSYFGSSVALSSDGRFLIVGAPAWSDDIVGSLSGAVQVFGV